MPSPLKIVVEVNDANQTVSNFFVGINDKIEFVNTHPTDQLVVKIKGYDSNPNIPIPFCQGNNQKVPVIEVPAKSTGTYHICNDYSAPRFAYEAKIGQAVTEDPIVIIERTSGGFTIDATSAILGAIAGLLAGFILARLLKGGKTRMPA